MYQSKIDTIKTNLDKNLNLMSYEIDRLEEYNDEMYYTIRSIEDRIFDMEHDYFEDAQLTFEQKDKFYRDTLEELEDAKGLRDIIQNELSTMIRARRAVEKAIEMMEDI